MRSSGGPLPFVTVSISSSFVEIRSRWKPSDMACSSPSSIGTVRRLHYRHCAALSDPAQDCRPKEEPMGHALRAVVVGFIALLTASAWGQQPASVGDLLQTLG